MKILKGAGLLFLTIIAWLVISQYFLCPRYSFPEPVPFSGSRLYNPYENIDTANWKKCNFHAHANVWLGLTNGHGTNEDVRKAYETLGYDLGLVSNYQKIDRDGQDEPSYISAYEHGNNIKKNHHLVIGSQHVTWLDYVFPQSLSNKQQLLNKLGEDSTALIVVNHPHERNGFTKNDLAYLTGYHCMEINTGTAASFEEWDAALSAGKPVFLAVNDDSHNVFDMFSIGRYSTWINSRELDKSHVIDAMRSGRSFGVFSPNIPNESLENRTRRLKDSLPRLTGFTLSGDSIHFSLSQQAKEIVFIGKNGSKLSSLSDTAEAGYKMKRDDPYVRATMYFPNGTEMYLNPVFRHEGQPFKMEEPRVKTGITVILKTVGFALLLGWLVLLFRFFFRRKRPSPAN